jgi:hypothetical protein
MDYEQKYLKYKIKYLIFMQNNPITFEQNGGGDINNGRIESKRSKYSHNSNIQYLILKFKSVKKANQMNNKVNDNLDNIYIETQNKLDKHLKNKSKNADKNNKLTAKNKK